MWEKREPFDQEPESVVRQTNTRLVLVVSCHSTEMWTAAALVLQSRLVFL